MKARRLESKVRGLKDPVEEVATDLWLELCHTIPKHIKVITVGKEEAGIRELDVACEVHQ